MNKPITILDFGVEGAIWIEEEGIWAKEDNTLDPILRALTERGYRPDPPQSVLRPTGPTRLLAVAWYQGKYKCRSCHTTIPDTQYRQDCPGCADPQPLRFTPVDISVFGLPGQKTTVF